METVSIWVRGVITGLLFLVVLLWLWVISGLVDEPVSQDASGNVLDQFQRSKDILLVVLPLLTTALGYWFGAAGADKAETRADEARQQAGDARRQLDLVLDAAPTGVLTKAMQDHASDFQSESQSDSQPEAP